MSGDLSTFELGAELNIPSRQIKRAPNGRIINQVLADYFVSDGPILELGIGAGELYGLLDDKYKAAYIGLDNNTDYLEIARRNYPDVELIEGDIGHLPYEDGSQTKVLALNVLDIIDKPEPASDEISRVLKPGGVFVHFHDRRPNLGFLLGHINSDYLVFPFINSDGFFDRFRLVRKDEFESRAKRLSLISLDWLDTSSTEQEIAVATNYPIVKAIAKDIDYVFGKRETSDDEVSPSFKAMFTQTLSMILIASGLDIQLAEDKSAETRVPDAEVGKLTAHTPIDAPYEYGNTFTIDENAHYHFGSQVRELPRGHTLLRTTLNVIVAAKLKQT